MLRNIVEVAFGVPMWLIAVGAPIAIGIACAAGMFGYARRQPGRFMALLTMVFGPYPVLLVIGKMLDLEWRPNFLFTTFVASIFVVFIFGHWLDDQKKGEA